MIKEESDGIELFEVQPVQERWSAVSEYLS